MYDDPDLKVEPIRKDDISYCLYCGKPIERASKGRPRKFCSVKCRRAWWESHPDKARKGEKAIYSFTCGYCGKDFNVYGNNNRKYCSRECYFKSRFGEKAVSCKHETKIEQPTQGPTLDDSQFDRQNIYSTAIANLRKLLEEDKISKEEFRAAAKALEEIYKPIILYDNLI